MKKALLVVSFGTSYLETLEKTICAIERDLAAAFPERAFYRAFTSGVIRRKLLRRNSVKVDGVVEALEELKVEGYMDILIQPTHMINGSEYERMMDEVRLYSDQFIRIQVGKPLLTSHQDYVDLAKAVMSEMPDFGFDEGLVLMGHGTEHHANPAYPAMEYVFHALGYTNVFVGTVEGYPLIEDVIQRLDEHINARRIYIAPLMIVAGDHAQNDMIGDAPNSWSNRLIEHNYYPIPIMRGLGEYAAVRQIFVEHAKTALNAKRKGIHR